MSVRWRQWTLHRKQTNENLRNRLYQRAWFKKPITYAQCRLAANGLFLERFGDLISFAHFEDFLNGPGPWVAGIDCPLGQRRKLIENIGWPETWESCIRHVSRMRKDEFVYALEEYCRAREMGDKHHLRRTDKIARSRSPMMLYRVPVGRMFFEAAPRLLKAGVSIQPCRVQDDPRGVVEAYPALVARRWIGDRSYKTDTVDQQTSARRSAREEIIAGLRSREAKIHFGFDIHLTDQDANGCIQDGPGDRLDALLCAVQAGWSYTQLEHNYGIPVDCDPLEGWIVDPLLASEAVSLHECTNMSPISREGRALCGVSHIPHD